ncbi:hypothetical protein ACH4SP_37440 [Streptomyces sp. NPDC021093]|uniref:hypothetical protein n=1 Tax=Streptomyces sp. NPDC021093 TaxID=3365112 RepID=UPI0037B852BC
MNTQPPTRTRKRTTLRLAACAALGLTLTAGVTTPAGAATRATTVRSVQSVQSVPIGTWQGTVTHGTGSDELTLSFHADGLVCLKLIGGLGSGTGKWRPTGLSTFSYEIRELIFAADGTLTGQVDINQQAVQQATTFQSSGISKIYDAQGNYLGSGEAKVSMRRASRDDQDVRETRPCP